MLRLSVPTRLAFAAVTLASAVALAETNRNDGDGPDAPPAAGTRLVIPTPPAMFTAVPHAQISGTIYLERCKGGCTVKQGANDARAMSSSIPTSMGGTHTVSEYRNGAGQ